MLVVVVWCGGVWRLRRLTLSGLAANSGFASALISFALSEATVCGSSSPSSNPEVDADEDMGREDKGGEVETVSEAEPEL